MAEPTPKFVQGSMWKIHKSRNWDIGISLKKAGYWKLKWGYWISIPENGDIGIVSYLKMGYYIWDIRDCSLLIFSVLSRPICRPPRSLIMNGPLNFPNQGQNNTFFKYQSCSLRGPSCLSDRKDLIHHLSIICVRFFFGFPPGILIMTQGAPISLMTKSQKTVQFLDHKEMLPFPCYCIIPSNTHPPQNSYKIFYFNWFILSTSAVYFFTKTIDKL